MAFCHHHPYAMHGAQMNHAIDLASNDWVLCMDSDEILDEKRSTLFWR
jgi:glycosyltransferase involved in cell wall biosynthesis